MGASAAVCGALWEGGRAAAADSLPLELREAAATQASRNALGCQQAQAALCVPCRESTTGTW